MTGKNSQEKKVSMEWQISSGEVSWFGNMKEILGISTGNSSLSIDDFLAHVHDDDREITKRAIMISVEKGIANVFNFRFIRPDRGEQLFIHALWCVESEGSRGESKIRGTLLDMTKRGIAV